MGIGFFRRRMTGLARSRFQEMSRPASENDGKYGNKRRNDLFHDCFLEGDDPVEGLLASPTLRDRRRITAV